MAPREARRATDRSADRIGFGADLEQRAPEASFRLAAGPDGVETDEAPAFRPLPHHQRWRGIQHGVADDKLKGFTARPGTSASPDADRATRPRGATGPAGGKLTSQENGTTRERASVGGHAFPRSKSLGRVMMLGAGVSIGLGLGHLIAMPGGFRVGEMRAAVSSAVLGTRDRGAALVATVADPRPRPAMSVRSDMNETEAAASAGVSTVRGEGERRSSYAQAAASGAGVRELLRQAEEEIAANRLEQPPGSNAIETYHRLSALAPHDPATAQVGERLSSALWTLATDARNAERWDDAIRYFGLLETLPPVPTSAILRGSAPAKSASGAVGAPGNMEVMPSPMSSPESDGASLAPAAPSVPKDVSQATGLRAFGRANDAMRSGDVIAARRFYEVAASAGIAGAATGIARTYDPSYLRHTAIRGVQGDAGMAKQWYQLAIEAGDEEASVALSQLTRSLENGRRR